MINGTIVAEGRGTPITVSSIIGLGECIIEPRRSILHNIEELTMADEEAYVRKLRNQHHIPYYKSKRRKFK